MDGQRKPNVLCFLASKKPCESCVKAVYSNESLKYKYIDVYAEVVVCSYQRHVTLRHLI